MNIIVSSCGRFHAFHLANFLESRGLLEHFFYAGIPQDKTCFQENNLSFHEFISLADRVFVKLHLDNFIAPSRWYTSRDCFFDNWVATKLKPQSKKIDIFVGWANCSLRSIVEAKKNGALTIIEAGSMHINEQEEILKNEFKSVGLSAPLILKENKCRMLNEHKIADFIFVPSDHVKESFERQGIDPKKIIKINYGCNVQSFGVSLDFLKQKSWDPLKFLFVGALGIQKGIHILLKSWQIIYSKNKEFKAELHLVGSQLFEFKTILAQFNNLKNIFIHPPQTQIDLKKFYETCHILVHPSVQDGLAMVIGEAMAAGLVVICSKNSGGEELITENLDGFILINSSVDILAQKIEWATKNINSLISMGFLAQKKAQKYTWKNYGASVVNKYKELLLFFFFYSRCSWFFCYQ